MISVWCSCIEGKLNSDYCQKLQEQQNYRIDFREPETQVRQENKRPYEQININLRFKQIINAFCIS